MLQHKPTYSVIQVDLPCVIYFSTTCGRQLADQEKLEYIIILSRHWAVVSCCLEAGTEWMEKMMDKKKKTHLLLKLARLEV